MINQQKNTAMYFIIALIISMIIWGAAWPASKVITNYSSIANILFVRYFLVVISMVPFLYYYKIGFKIETRGWFRLAMAGTLMALYSHYFLKGLQHGMAGAGGVLVTTLNPIFAYSIGLIIQKKLPNKTEAFGLGIGIVAGMVLLQIWQNFDLLLTSGNLYFLLCAFLWAAMSKFGSKASDFGHSLSFSLWIYVITVFWMGFSIDFSATKRLIFDSKIDFWLLIFYTSVIGTSLATSIYFLATTKLGAEKASSFIFIVPFSAAVSSWIFLDETIKPHTIVGGILGISAVIVLNGDFKILKK